MVSSVGLPRREVEYLELEDLLGLVGAPGVGSVQDVGLLDAGCARPHTTVFGQQAYPSVQREAAALLHSLVRSHGLVDGDERLGWLAAAEVLDVNGHPPDLTDDEAFALVMALADGSLDVDEIAQYLGS